jgi:hypothetical protein
MIDKMESLKEELKAVFEKYKVLPKRYSEQVILTFNDGGIRGILRGKKPVPIDKGDGE